MNSEPPQTHQQYANTTPASLLKQAAGIESNTLILVERLMRVRPHPQQSYRAAQGVLSLSRRYGPARMNAACERALTINALCYSSVSTILKSGLDQAPPVDEPVKPAPPHGNIRGSSYYQ